MLTKNLLIELGTEELPPKALRKLAEAFKDNFTNELIKASINFSEIKWYATPRRLALKVLNISTKQNDKVIEKKGPSVSVAFSDNKPTKIGLAWAKSIGITIDQASKIQTPKGEWLVYTTKEQGVNTASLLPEIVSRAVSNLPIPKLMHWGTSNILFVRPVHTFTMLLGDELINCEVLGLKSLKTINGHRFMGEQTLTINSADEYPEILKNKGMVIADYNERKQLIINAITAEAKKIGGNADMDDSLIEEVTSLVEYPVLLTAKFEERFLNVPAEALVHTMKGDQKYFPVYKDGKLLPNFIFISNIISKSPEIVIQGNERVIRPRLSDAEFFFNTDKKQSLFSRFDSLKNVLFHKQLGSLAQKSEWVATIASNIAKNINANCNLAYRSGILSKCDLMTNMVMEFTDTQGIMGMHYARIDGENEEVALAMNEQYLPRFAGDELPNTLVTSAVSLAEKIVTLVGIFGINQLPKGDKDPFGLRRASIGLIRILVEKQINLDIKDFIIQARDLIGDKITNKNVVSDVIEYITGRFKAYYQDLSISTDIVQSVLSLNITNLLEFDKRVKAVREFKNLPEAEFLSAANKRVRNILNKTSNIVNFNDKLLQDKEEINLFNSIINVESQITALMSENNYTGALNKLAALKEPIDKFFEDVMVNCEDVDVKNNRIALLFKLQNLLSNIADISTLQK
ncbi:MAG: glycine--tRNA ligase subunit beta [Succinivibrionaceae bacterium]